MLPARSSTLAGCDSDELFADNSTSLNNQHVSFGKSRSATLVLNWEPGQESLFVRPQFIV
jgi:hypothetical protein